MAFRQLSFCALAIVLVLAATHSTGYSVKKVIEIDGVEVTTVDSIPITGRDDITDGEALVLSDVTEEQSLADEIVVTTEYFNEADNEIDRVERDVGVVEGVTSESVTELVNNDEHVVEDETTEPQVVQTTQKPFSAVVDDGNYPQFTRPITPDPNASPSDFTTVNPLPDDYDRQQIDLNITDESIYGRAACQCGVPVSRIVGGEPARVSDLPWTAALLRGSGGRPYCGGTLINSLYVVTASHCVDGMSAGGISVLLNEQDFNSASETRPQKFGVANIKMHPNYNRRTIDNDIALLRLSSPVKLSSSGPIVPVCLPASNANHFAKEQATVAGWGTTSSGGGVSTILRKVTVPVLSNNDCNTKTKYQNKITENMLCAGLLETGGKDSCQGDSGGPLIIQNGGRRTLIGVVSWGYGCAAAHSPGVYTRVGRFPDWILANTKGADWCEG